MEGGIQGLAALVHGQQVSLGDSLGPIQKRIPTMLDQCAEVEGNARHSCTLDVEFERIPPA